MSMKTFPNLLVILYGWYILKNTCVVKILTVFKIIPMVDRDEYIDK